MVFPYGNRESTIATTQDHSCSTCGPPHLRLPFGETNIISMAGATNTRVATQYEKVTIYETHQKNHFDYRRNERHRL
jgi:hypothetical protein